MTTFSSDSSVFNQHTPGLTDLIRTRRSIAVFRPAPIPDGLVASLLESAVYAPNHRLTQPWRFVYITGEGVKRYAAIRQAMALPGFQKLHEAEREKAAAGVYHKFASVPAYLLVVMHTNSNPEVAEEDYAACAALIQNFLLLAWEQGLGSCWKTFKQNDQMQAFIRLNPRKSGRLDPSWLPGSRHDQRSQTGP